METPDVERTNNNSSKVIADKRKHHKLKFTNSKGAKVVFEFVVCSSWSQLIRSPLPEGVEDPLSRKNFPHVFIFDVAGINKDKTKRKKWPAGIAFNDISALEYLDHVTKELQKNYPSLYRFSKRKGEEKALLDSKLPAIREDQYWFRAYENVRKYNYCFYEVIIGDSPRFLLFDIDKSAIAMKSHNYMGYDPETLYEASINALLTATFELHDKLWKAVPLGEPLEGINYVRCDSYPMGETVLNPEYKRSTHLVCRFILKDYIQMEIFYTLLKEHVIEKGLEKMLSWKEPCKKDPTKMVTNWFWDNSMTSDNKALRLIFNSKMELTDLSSPKELAVEKEKPLLPSKNGPDAIQEHLVSCQPYDLVNYPIKPTLKAPPKVIEVRREYTGLPSNIDLPEDNMVAKYMADKELKINLPLDANILSPKMKMDWVARVLSRFPYQERPIRLRIGACLYRYFLSDGILEVGWQLWRDYCTVYGYIIDKQEEDWRADWESFSKYNWYPDIGTLINLLKELAPNSILEPLRYCINCKEDYRGKHNCEEETIPESPIFQETPKKMEIEVQTPTAPVKVVGGISSNTPISSMCLGSRKRKLEDVTSEDEETQIAKDAKLLIFDEDTMDPDKSDVINGKEEVSDSEEEPCDKMEEVDEATNDKEEEPEQFDQEVVKKAKDILKKMSDKAITNNQPKSKPKAKILVESSQEEIEEHVCQTCKTIYQTEDGQCPTCKKKPISSKETGSSLPVTSTITVPTAPSSDIEFKDGTPQYLLWPKKPVEEWKITDLLFVTQILFYSTPRAMKMKSTAEKIRNAVFWAYMKHPDNNKETFALAKAMYIRWENSSKTNPLAGPEFEDKTQPFQPLTYFVGKRDKALLTVVMPKGGPSKKTKGPSKDFRSDRDEDHNHLTKVCLQFLKDNGYVKTRDRKLKKKLIDAYYFAEVKRSLHDILSVLFPYHETDKFIQKLFKDWGIWGKQIVEELWIVVSDSFPYIYADEGMYCCKNGVICFSDKRFKQARFVDKNDKNPCPILFDHAQIESTCRLEASRKKDDLHVPCNALRSKQGFSLDLFNVDDDSDNNNRVTDSQIQRTENMFADRATMNAMDPQALADLLFGEDEEEETADDFLTLDWKDIQAGKDDYMKMPTPFIDKLYTSQGLSKNAMRLIYGLDGRIFVGRPQQYDKWQIYRSSHGLACAGKSTRIMLIVNILGKERCAKLETMSPTTFHTATIANAWYVMTGDLTDKNPPHPEAIHEFTDNADTNVNEKNVKIKTMHTLEAHLETHSNPILKLPNGDGQEERRVILTGFTEKPKYIEDFEGKITKEMPVYLIKCIMAYWYLRREVAKRCKETGMKIHEALHQWDPYFEKQIQLFRDVNTPEDNVIAGDGDNGTWRNHFTFDNRSIVPLSVALNYLQLVTSKKMTHKIKAKIMSTNGLAVKPAKDILPVIRDSFWYDEKIDTLWNDPALAIVGMDIPQGYWRNIFREAWCKRSGFDHDELMKLVPDDEDDKYKDNTNLQMSRVAIHDRLVKEKNALGLSDIAQKWYTP